MKKVFFAFKKLKQGLAQKLLSRGKMRKGFYMENVNQRDVKNGNYNEKCTQACRAWRFIQAQIFIHTISRFKYAVEKSVTEKCIHWHTYIGTSFVSFFIWLKNRLMLIEYNFFYSDFRLFFVLASIFSYFLSSFRFILMNFYTALQRIFTQNIAEKV